MLLIDKTECAVDERMITLLFEKHCRISDRGYIVIPAAQLKGTD